MVDVVVAVVAFILGRLTRGRRYDRGYDDGYAAAAEQLDDAYVAGLSAGRRGR